MGLRVALHVRHVPAAHPRGVPGGAPRLLAHVRQPVGDGAPGRDLHRPLLRPGGQGDGGRPDQVPLGGRRDGAGGGVRQPDPRLQDPQHHQPASLARRPVQRDRPRQVQPGRLHERRGAASARGDNLVGAVPLRLDLQRPRASPEAAVLLRVGDAAGHRAAVQEAAHARLEQLPGEERHPAERHAPVHRSAGADAVAHRRRGHELR
mmetsp:Transcript_23788/g.76438  ORF Transcript_23788/g.76438 Transcript_23788/m.76438 type:complete len:206 (-) Transcript_23788:1750-2367(-)